jgi:hypothetical protein
VRVPMKFCCGLVMAILAVCCCACEDPYQDPLPRRDRLHYPIGLEIHPEGRFLYVVNSNFDARYRQSLGGSVSVIDTESRRILADTSPYLPSFGGYIRLNADASRAYVTARRDNVVVAFDVMAPENRAEALAGQGLYCEDDDGEQAADPNRCVLGRIPDDESGEFISADPFGLAVTTVSSADPSGYSVDLLNVSHLASANVTTIAVPKRSSMGSNNLSSADALRAASIATSPLVAGANEVAQRPNTMEFYTAGRNTNEVLIYQPFLSEDGQVEAVISRGSVSLNKAVSSVDARAVAFDASGERLYVVTRNPDALHIIAITQDVRDEGQTISRRLLNTISLSNSPTDVVLHTGPAGKTHLYIPSYDANLIDVVDPELGRNVARIELGASPYQFVVDTAESRCAGEGTSCYGYVSLFDDTTSFLDRCGSDEHISCGSIGVIDLDPASPRYQTLVDKIR